MRWSRPEAVVQEFAANEYVAACWKIKCNVPYGFAFYDVNGDGKYTKRADGDKIASGYGCGTYHIGVQSDSGPVASAMWQPTNREGDARGSAYPVFMFTTGNHNNGHHFSKVSDAEWETNPNAS